jgi:hypothetical protein
MKFTALIREIVTRDIRVIVTADSKGQAKRLLANIAAHPTRYKEGIVASRTKDVSPVLESIEPLTVDTIARIHRLQGRWALSLLWLQGRPR